MAQYATIADLVQYGLPATALGNLTVAQQNAALEEASRAVDGFLRGRYSLPLISWSTEITRWTCVIAAWNLLNVRGYNPASGADINIKLRFDNAIEMLSKTQRQAYHPELVPQPDQTPQFNQPKVISSSVVSVATGRVAANRGW